MLKEIEINDKLNFAVWYPDSGTQLSAYLIDRSTGYRTGPFHTIAFVDDLRTLDLIRVSDSEVQVKINDTVVTVSVIERSITIT